jgi:hypothetical protein
MSLAGLTSGIDNKLSFIDLTGVKQFTYVESFTSKEDATVDKLVQMNGVITHPKFHMGWSGSFVLQRNSDFMDAYTATQEAAYYQGVGQIPMTITQTISESDGTTSQWQYTDVVITLDDAGQYSGTEIVKQRATFNAFRKNQLVV